MSLAYAPPSHASAISYARSLARAYSAGHAAGAFENPRCPFANPPHVVAWRQGLADRLGEAVA